MEKSHIPPDRVGVPEKDVLERTERRLEELAQKRTSRDILNKFAEWGGIIVPFPSGLLGLDFLKSHYMKEAVFDRPGLPGFIIVFREKDAVILSLQKSEFVRRAAFTEDEQKVFSAHNESFSNLLTVTGYQGTVSLMRAIEAHYRLRDANRPDKSGYKNFMEAYALLKDEAVRAILRSKRRAAFLQPIIHSTPI